VTSADPAAAAPAPDTVDEDADERAAAAIIARHNDAFRTAGGAHPVHRGRVVATRGVADRGVAFTSAVLAAVKAFTAFDAENDPCGHHDFGVVTVEGVAVWFKIDLYDAAYEYAAENPTDPNATRRVLTVLLPDEY
jgi:hypothetical protein